MSEKRLLMIVPFFPPMAGGGVYRPLAFVKYLERFGWRTTVIAPRGDAFWIHDGRMVDQIPGSCDVIRTETLSGQGLLARWRGGQPRCDGHAQGGKRTSQIRSSGRFSALRSMSSFFLFPDTYVGWRPYAINAAVRALERYDFDAVYSTSPPETSHSIALKVYRRTRLPWVADFRDPWMNLYLFKPPTALHTALHERMERRICAHAHAVVTTRWHEELLRRKYPGARGVTRIPNGFDISWTPAIEQAAPPRDRFRITHAGMLTQNRTAVPFMLALRRFLAERPDARARTQVLFVGAREDKNEKAAQELGLNDVVEFRDSLPHDEALQLERASHILLLIKHVNPDYRGIVPGKLYEYIGVRRPILALVPDGEAAQLVEKLRRGVLAPQEDECATARILGQLYGAFEQGKLDEAFDLSPRPEFARESLTGELAGLLDRLTDPSGGAGEREHKNDG